MSLKEKVDIRFLILIAITILVGIWRILQATDEISAFANFTPIGAMALFGGAYFTNKSKALLFPILTLLFSDLIMMHTVYAKYNDGMLLYSGWYWNYAAFALMVVIGFVMIKRVTIKNLVFSSLLAGFAHFIISDFGVWLGGGIDMTTGLPFTKDLSGLMSCYIHAIPYLKNMIAGNLIYSVILFGGFELAKKRFQVLQSTAL